MKKRSKKQEIQNMVQNDERPVSVDVFFFFFNHGKYLRKALDGMLMQETNFPVTIFIHDDASTDDSVDIILEYKKLYPEQIVTVLEDENMYQNGKSIWKKMFPYFTGKYVAYCEGDDYWIDKNKLQKQVDYLEKNLDCIACYHNILPVDINGEYNESLRGIYSLLDEGDYTKKEIRHGKLKTQTASLVRRNYNPWLTDNEKEVYLKARCNGDEKQLVLCGTMGRVHYLPDIMAAHRRVFSEGKSWTAIQNNKKEYEKFISGQKRCLEVCSLYEQLNKKKSYPYNEILNNSLSYYIYQKRANKHLSSEEKKAIRSNLHIPFYAYIAFIPSLVKRFLVHIVHKLKMEFFESETGASL